MCVPSSMLLKVSCQHRNGDVFVLTLNARQSLFLLHFSAHASTVLDAVLLSLPLTFPRRCVSGPRYLLTKQSLGGVVVVTVVAVAVALVSVFVVPVTDVVVDVVVVEVAVVVVVVEGHNERSMISSTNSVSLSKRSYRLKVLTWVLGSPLAITLSTEVEYPPTPIAYTSAFLARKAGAESSSVP